MNQFVHYLRNYKKESVIGPLFKLLEACFELLVPLVMASIIDTGIANHDKGHIYRMGGILVLLGVVGLICSVTAQYFAAKASVGFGTAIRKDLFQHINTLSYREIDKLGTSTLITRITSDINQMQTVVNLVLRLFLRSPFVVIGAMVMAFTVNVKGALVFVVAIPLLSIVVFGIMLSTVPLYKKVQRKLDRILLSTRENLAGVRVIRAFNRQEHEEKVFRDTSNELYKLQIFVGKVSSVLNPLTYIIVNLALIAIIWIGGIEVDSGIIKVGEVTALVNYMSQILVELIKLVNLIINITKGIACSNRVQEIFNEQPSLVSPDHSASIPDSDIAVAFDHVTFSYHSGQEAALENISFTAKKGETIGIIGGTGSGKSSLVNLIPRFYDTSSGEVRIHGLPVQDYNFDDLRTRIGVVPQRAVLFKGTIRENMKWGNQNATDEEIMEALTIAQAKDVVEQKDGKLDFLIEQEGKNLSGGQKQRLTIARALVKHPEILILDDSASALDFATDARLRKALAECSSSTVFLVSQRSATVKNADKIIVLDDGQMAGIGTHQELYETCEVYKEICDSQLSKEEVQK
ncbi:MAG: ABC transporter ATP-binding protein [Lachnospiraceae bacterium]|nr:ABC transporter ATP-binding protein [Lachnospiraceae bacterium]